MIKIKGKHYAQGAEPGFQPQAISQDIKVEPKFLNQVLYSPVHSRCSAK
jgi:hypothetical protein